VSIGWVVFRKLIHVNSVSVDFYFKTVNGLTRSTYILTLLFVKHGCAELVNKS